MPEFLVPVSVLLIEIWVFWVNLPVTGRVTSNQKDRSISMTLVYSLLTFCGDSPWVPVHLVNFHTQ